MNTRIGKDEFIQFTLDEVMDNTGTLLVSRNIVENQSDLLRKMLTNIIVTRAEYITLENCFAYQGYSPMFDKGNNPNRRYQVWYDSSSDTLKFHPDPDTLSVYKN